MNTYFMTVNDDGKLILSMRRQDDTSDVDVVITSMEQLRNLAGENQIMCSSTVDFPEEYTEDPKVIAMCNLIRGGEVTDPELLAQITTILGV